MNEPEFIKLWRGFYGDKPKVTCRLCHRNKFHILVSCADALCDDCSEYENYIAPSKRDEKNDRLKLWLRDHGKVLESDCPFCKRPIDIFNFDNGHDKAKSLGGSDDASNRAAICHRCNILQQKLSFEEFETKNNRPIKVRLERVKDEDLYPVKMIVAIDEENKMYKVRWKGYGPKHDTWEPVESFTKPVHTYKLSPNMDYCSYLEDM